MADAALQTCRVVCFANRIVRAASSGDKVNFVAGVAFVIDESLAGNIDFEVANFQVLRKNPYENNVSKLEKVSHEMLVLMLPRVSSRVSGFPVASPCLWGKLSKQVGMSFCMAGAALCDIPTWLISL